jgi:hypothetical protein
MESPFPPRLLYRESFYGNSFFGGLLLPPFPAAVGDRIRFLVQCRVRLWFPASGEGGLRCIDTFLRDIWNGGELACSCLPGGLYLETL